MCGLSLLSMWRNFSPGLSKISGSATGSTQNHTFIMSHKKLEPSSFGRMNRSSSTRMSSLQSQRHDTEGRNGYTLSRSDLTQNSVLLLIPPNTIGQGDDLYFAQVPDRGLSTGFGVALLLVVFFFFTSVKFSFFFKYFRFFYICDVIYARKL